MPSWPPIFGIQNNFTIDVCRKNVHLSHLNAFLIAQWEFWSPCKHIFITESCPCLYNWPYNKVKGNALKANLFYSYENCTRKYLVMI